MTEPIVDLLATEWSSLSELGSRLQDAEWDLPTDLPGWSVRDNFSHVIGTERMLLGETPPEGYDAEARAAHVKNPIGEVNERWVAARRNLSGTDVLAEFGEVTARRLDSLRAMGTADFDKEGWSPVGQVPYREFMEIRLMDSWAHEQDVRRATSRPGNLTGPVAEKCLGRVVSALPYIVGKKAAAPEGARVVFDVAGPVVRRVAIVVENGRARQDASFPEERPSPATVAEGATSVLTLTSEALCCVGFGRWQPADALADGRIALSGDAGLGRAVALALPFMV